MYRRAGKEWVRCGSLAMIGRPVAVREAEIAQLFDPSESAARTTSPRGVTRRQRWASAIVAASRSGGDVTGAVASPNVSRMGGGVGAGLRPGQPLGGERHRRRRQRERVENGERDVGKVEAFRNGGRDLGLDLAAQRIKALAALGHHVGADHFRHAVAGQAMAADADDIFRLPARRAGVHQREFFRQRRFAGLYLRDARIDAPDEGGADVPRVRPVGGPLRLHVSRVEEEPRRPVLLQVARPEIGRQKAEAALAPEVDLPQAVARCVPALGEEQVVLCFGPDMGNALPVDGDFDGPFETGQHERGPGMLRLSGVTHYGSSACAMTTATRYVELRSHLKARVFL